MIHEAIRRYAEAVGLSDEAQDAFEAEADRIRRNPAFDRSFRSLVAAYDCAGEAYNFSGMAETLPEMIEAAGLCVYTTEFLLYLCFLPTLERLYREKGFDPALLTGVMQDMNCKSLECKAVKNVWGSFVCIWFSYYLCLRLFPLGRLQYELIHISQDLDSPYAGQKAVNVHIPSTGPLNRQSIEDSFAQAASFFADAFEGDSVLLTCSSWLLSPYHREVLSPSSGIVTFMDCFDAIVPVSSSGKDTLWRVFLTDDFHDLSALPRDTTLRRGYLKLLEEKQPFTAGVGIRVIKKL